MAPFRKLQRLHDAVPICVNSDTPAKPHTKQHLTNGLTPVLGFFSNLPEIALHLVLVRQISDSKRCVLSRNRPPGRGPSPQTAGNANSRLAGHPFAVQAGRSASLSRIFKPMIAAYRPTDCQRATIGGHPPARSRQTLVAAKSALQTRELCNRAAPALLRRR